MKIISILLKIRTDIFIQFIFICLYFFQLLLFSLEDGINQLEIDIIQYELLVFYLYVLIYAYKKMGAFSLYSLFLYTMFIFIYGRIFLDILGLFDWYWANKWMDFYFPLSTQYEILYHPATIFAKMFEKISYQFIKPVSVDRNKHRDE